MLSFDPSRIEAKREGRDVLAKMAGIPLEEAAPYFVSVATLQNFRSCFNNFVTHYPLVARRISDYRPDGIGPGEMIAWFIFDNITLGGKSALQDLLADGIPFAEMKGGTPNKSLGTLDNFKITRDSDDAVNQLISDMDEFNTAYKKLTGHDLEGWYSASEVKTSCLSKWASIDLTDMEPAELRPKPVVIQPDGSITDDTGNFIGHVSDPAIGSMLQQSLLLSGPEYTLGRTRDIVVRWAKTAMENYVEGKTFALVNSRTLELQHFGPINLQQIDLYCIHRNQPWARITV